LLHVLLPVPAQKDLQFFLGEQSFFRARKSKEHGRKRKNNRKSKKKKERKIGGKRKRERKKPKGSALKESSSFRLSIP